MLLMGIILLSGLLPRLARYNPAASIAGFLLVIGTALAIPANLGGVITPADSISGPAAIVVTTTTSDPFLGIVAGVVVRTAMRLLAGI